MDHRKMERLKEELSYNFYNYEVEDGKLYISCVYDYEIEFLSALSKKFNLQLELFSKFFYRKVFRFSEPVPAGL